jgi:hypothetical protein
VASSLARTTPAAIADAELVQARAYSLVFALQMLSPKQKELFKKRLEGLPLTKTEQEYYSRSVKKKVVALANAELHGLARKLLEK